MSDPSWLAPTPAGIPRLSDSTTVSSFPAAQRELAAAIDAILGGIQNRAPIKMGTNADANALTTPGEYHFETAAVAATAKNLPVDGQPGILVVRKTSNGIVSQVFLTYAGNVNIFYRATNSVTNGTFTGWNSANSHLGRRISNVDLNNLKTPDRVYTTTATEAATVTNWPTDRPGWADILATPNGIWMQIVRPYGGGQGFFVRTTQSVTNGTWGVWDHFAPGGGDSAGPYRRTMLVDAFTRRRGGAIGTAGLPAVALRFDHGMDNFKSIVLPLLKKYKLPWSQAMNSRMHTTASNANQNRQMSFTELQTAALNTGGEAWNHSADHINATSLPDLTDQIVTGLTELQAALPALAIEGWAPPGIAAPAYGGAGGFGTAEVHYNTAAGRLMLSHHAALSGYIGGAYRDLPSGLNTPLDHVTLDNITSLSPVRTALNAIAAGQPSGVLFMVHPALIGTTGITAVMLEDVFREIATRRDAGELVVLTPSGLLLADHRTSYRHDLVTDGTFKLALTKWGNANFYTLPTERGVTFARTDTGSPLTQAISLQRKEHLAGSARELVAMVRTNGTAVVRLLAAIPGQVDAVNDVTITAAKGWHEIRQPFVIPATADATTALTIHAGRLSGSRVDLRNIRVRSI